MSRPIAALVCMTLLAAAAEADPVIGSCEDRPAGLVVNLIEPLEQTTRAYAAGRVRVFAIGPGEPACCGIYIAVLHPDADGLRTCTAVSQGEGSGWSAVRFDARREATYDAATGLDVPMLVTPYDGADFVDRSLVLRIDQARGTVTVVP